MFEKRQPLEVRKAASLVAEKATKEAREDQREEQAWTNSEAGGEWRWVETEVDQLFKGTSHGNKEKERRHGTVV